jgi:hypothetical protein
MVGEEKSEEGESEREERSKSKRRRIRERRQCSAGQGSVVPSVWSAGAKGCMLHVSGHVTGCISTVAFSFMVQLPVRDGVGWGESRVG